MQLEKFKRIISVALASVLTCALFISCISAGAAEEYTSSISTHKPVITAEYRDASGNVADGNALSAGTYEMVLRVDDLASISQMQFTASYDANVLSFSNGVLPLATDSSLNLNAVHLESANGSFVFAYNSGNYDSCSALPDNGAELVKISLTVLSSAVDTAIDINSALTIDTNPNRTFIEVDYRDATVSGLSRVYKCYALSTADDFTGEVFPMECDLSPEISNGYSVSAYIGALTSPNEKYGSYPVTGAQVSIEVGGETLFAETDETGKFTFLNVPSGSYTATVSYKYGFTRTFTVKVENANVESAILVGIVACNWDGNTMINAKDKSKYLSTLGLRASDAEYDVGVDIDRNGTINAKDKQIYLAFVGYSSDLITYADTVIS
ncbi:MAG: carboxypeptidase regulatory-like domain-containing protein [Anaerotruncus sp.]|nr:carboxypeptidase regulatory-like domain-containing protein [Anaerotruncus sp.]